MSSENSTGQVARQSPARTGLYAALFVALAFLIFILPDTPSGLHPAAALRLPLEIPLIVLIALLLPPRFATVFAALVTLLIATLLFLKIADIGVLAAFQRRFNPYLDVKMIADGWNVLSGAIGNTAAALAVIAILAIYLAVLVALFVSLRKLARANRQGLSPVIAALAIILSLGFAFWLLGPRFNLPPLADFRAAGELDARLTLVGQSITDMRKFEQQLKAPDSLPPSNELFAGVRGQDVILIFIESYGRSAVEDPRYSGLIKPRLADIEHSLAASGYGSASGWSRSPTVGGLSWLAHGTFLSGLWTDNQARYDRLMISGRKSLNRLFSEAGWQTSAVMPAITLDWPEADYFDYDQILPAKALGYQGKPFNWITMPDQYTLTALDRLAREPAHAAGKAAMVETALISSHAPWTPVPSLVDWESVGDGRIFNEQATSGESPATVWADPENVRRHYIRTIDYSLQTVGDYIARFGNDAIFIILGDHQPASIVTGPDASRAVPIHIVSRDKALVERFEAEGYTAGMMPAPDAPEQPMDSMRDRLIRLFAAPATPAG